MSNEKIVLGSGKIYCVEYAGSIPEDTVIETEDNRLGYVQGGATLEYAPTFYEAKDDLGYVSKTILTEETATLKSGIMTFNGETLTKLCTTGRVTETEGKRTVLIGGAGNQDGKSYVIRFVHNDAVEGDIRVTIVGRNEAGFSLSFAKDKETVIDAEFKALAKIDTEGTLIKYEEEIKNA